MLSIWKIICVGVIVSAFTLHAAAQTTQPAALKPYTESIPGSLVTFEMIPVTGEGIKPFYIGKTEITWDAYSIYAYQLDLSETEKAAGVDAKSRPSKPYGAPDRGFGTRGYPAMSITLNAAQQYCSWLSKKTGRKYRLPTIEEWQYAARAGSDKDELSPAELKKVAWYWDNSDSKTHPVAKLAPNAFGLHDMLGNIAEWVTLPDGEGVVCGGSYDDEAGDVRLDAAKPYNPAWQTADPQDPKSTWWLSDGPMVGLRVVCDP